MAKGDRGGKRGGGDLLGKGGDTGKVLDTSDMISQRGKYQTEVDDVLSVSQRMNNLFGNEGQIEQFQIAKMTGRAMAYYDSNGNIAVNSRYMNSKGMNAAYDAAVKNNFHPSRGNKTGMEATAAHEFGHALTERVGAKMGKAGFDNLESVARDVVERARSKTKHSTNMSFAGKISGYAQYNFAECVAEATSDWFCNGSKAKKESRAIVAVMNSILKK